MESFLIRNTFGHNLYELYKLYELWSGEYRGRTDDLLHAMQAL